MLIGALRLPDANSDNLVCGYQYHLSIADLKARALSLSLAPLLFSHPPSLSLSLPLSLSPNISGMHF